MAFLHFYLQHNAKRHAQLNKQALSKHWDNTLFPGGDTTNKTSLQQLTMQTRNKTAHYGALGL